MHVESENMIDIVQKVAFTFQYSAKRINMFKKELKENIQAKGSMGKKTQKLQTMCETRWASLANALFTFKAFLEVIDDCNVVLLFCGLKEKEKHITVSNFKIQKSYALGKVQSENKLRQKLFKRKP